MTYVNFPIFITIQGTFMIFFIFFINMSETQKEWFLLVVL